MVKAENVPVSIPEMDVLTEEQEQAVSKLLTTVMDDNSGQYPFFFEREGDDAARRRLAYKFLKARKWNFNESLTMVRSTLAFREAYGLNDWDLFPCVFPLKGYDERQISEVLHELHLSKCCATARRQSDWDRCFNVMRVSYPSHYHYWDKEGHPVLYDGCGGADAEQIVKGLGVITPPGKAIQDVVLSYHIYMNEIQYYLLRYADYISTKAGRRHITGVTVVMNAEGLNVGMLQKKFISIVQTILEVDQSHYPEVLHRLFIINCPKLVSMAYKLVGSSIDENTKRKIVFCSKSESLDVLKRVIDEDKIPSVIGGTCECPGGCLCALPANRHRDSHSTEGAVHDELSTKYVVVKAGSKYTLQYGLSAGDEIFWQFCAVGTDIRFVVESEGVGSLSQSCSSGRQTENRMNIGAHHTKGKHSKVASMREVVRAETVAKDASSFVAQETSILYLCWDNTNSWLNKKEIQLRVWRKGGVTELALASDECIS